MPQRLPSLLAAFVLLALLGVSCGQGAPESTPAGVQDVYDRMSAAYESGDMQAIGNLYTEDAAYVVPNRRAPVISGRDSIVKQFEGFLGSVRDRGATASIDFRFVKRSAGASRAHDVGYYRTTVTRNDSVLSRGTGKFATVLEKGSDGVWRFAVDAYTPAPDSLFEMQ
jgi:uncharacterized protein (TIGR02246 family)